MVPLRRIFIVGFLLANALFLINFVVSLIWESFSTNGMLRKSFSGQSMDLSDPSLERKLTDPSLERNLINPALESNLSDPSLGWELTDPSLERKLTDASLERNLLDPFLERNLLDPVLERNLTDPFLERNLIDPSLKRDLIDPSLESNLTDPSLEMKIYGDLNDCQTKPLAPYSKLHGEYWVLNNYIPAMKSFRCQESITLTTIGEYSYLDNLVPLTSRWQGPVSMAVIASGTDFNAAIETILYLRNCVAEEVRKFVTFHFLFHVNHVPSLVPTTKELFLRKTNCPQKYPHWNETTYRQSYKMMLPINIARNVAKENSQTYFIFPSDVELYPSINFIPEFFKMLKKPDVSSTTNQRVYVFPIFEISEEQRPPETKSELQMMLKANTAIPFHMNVCPSCHNQPKSTEWQSAKPTLGLSVFHIAKRTNPYHRWEPFYVGTNREPIFDDRLYHEGKGEKFPHMYILCVRDYEFHIFDNAFLVHRPGIKVQQQDPDIKIFMAQQYDLIKNQISLEYETIFGNKTGCEFFAPTPKFNSSGNLE